MPSLSDFIIISDLDGTLVPKGGKLVQRNLDALRRFVNRGGRFSVATGRSRQWTDQLQLQLPLSAPCILYNGGVIYDFATGEYLLRMSLPEDSDLCLTRVAQEFPQVCILVVTDSEYFQVTDEMSFASGHLRKYNTDFAVDQGWRNIPHPWYKVLFLLPDGVYDSFMPFVQGLPADDIRFVATNYNLVEMLPAGSSKGNALKYLIARGQFRREQIVAIGDFYNDLEMIQLAGIGVTLETSPQDIKDAADLVVGSCEGGALADLVEYLEKRYPD